MSVFAEFLLTIVLSLSASVAAYTAILHMPKTNGGVSRLHTGPSPRLANGVFLVLVGTYVFVFSYLSAMRHVSFNTGGFDVGVFDQAIWNSLRGRLLEVSIVPDTPNLLGQRFSPILLAFVPLYAVWSDPIVLLVVQTLALAIGAFPIYWLARERVERALALVIVLAYFLSPALEHVDLYEFHEVALVTPLFAFAGYFLLRGLDKAFIVCLGLAVLTKDEIAFSLIAFGAFILLVQRRKWLGLALASMGAVWAVAVLQYVIPFFRGTEFGTGYYYFGNGMGAGRGRYDYLGGSLFEILGTAFTRPDILLPHILVLGKLEYLLHLFVPLAFLPLVGAELAGLALPTLGFSLLSSFPFQYSIDSHYAAPLLPFLFFASILGLQRILRWRTRDARINGPARTWALVVLVLSASSISYYLHSPGPFARQFDPSQYAVTAHTMAGYQFMRSIPRDGTLVAQKELTPHLTERRRIYEFPFAPDYRQADYLLIDTTHFGYGIFRNSWNEWLNSGYFQTVREQDGYVLAQRKPPQNPIQIRYADRMTLLGYTIVYTDGLRGGQKLQLAVEWRANQDLRERYVVQAYLIDEGGHLWARDEQEPDGGTFPTTRWIAGQLVGDQYTFALPSVMPPGHYQITLGVYDPQKNQNLNAVNGIGQPIGDEPSIATVHVEKDKSSITASQLRIEQPLFVDMHEMRFLGYVPPRSTISPGETIQIGLYWRAREKPRGDYVVAVQLRDAEGRVAFEQSTRPANGTYPTTLWDPGEVLLDWHDFTIPPEMAAGSYEIAILLRDLSSGQSLGETPISLLAVTR